MSAPSRSTDTSDALGTVATKTRSLTKARSAKQTRQIAVAAVDESTRPTAKQAPRLVHASTISASLTSFVPNNVAVSHNGGITGDASSANSGSAVQPSRHASSGQLYGEMVETQEVEALCSGLGMSRDDVWRLRKQFNDEDEDSTNSITQTAFFYLIKEERNNLTKTIFRLGKVSPNQLRLTFDEYLACVCAFASLAEVDLLRFFYDVYTDESVSSSAMGESDILKLGKELQAIQSSFAKNVGVATKKMVSSRDLLTQQTLVTFDEFQRMARLHSVAFYPLFQMQRNVRFSALGEDYWLEKARERYEVARMLQYMVRNYGRAVDVDWKTKLLDFVFQRESSQARVRRRAREQYNAQYRRVAKR